MGRGGQRILGVRRALWTAAALAVFGGPAAAFDDIHLLDVRVGSGLSSSIRQFAYQGFELSDGTPIVFGDWYRSDWRDLQAMFLTPLDDEFGLIWGFGTGESGGRYEIEPSLRIGFTAREELSPWSEISLTATAVIGGRLKEYPCQANYGIDSTTYTVNCRLAASPLPPSETLDYLLDEPPLDQLRVNFTYRFSF